MIGVKQFIKSNIFAKKNYFMLFIFFLFLFSDS